MTVLLLSSEVAGLNFETHETFSIWVQWANPHVSWKQSADACSACHQTETPDSSCVWICKKIPNCNGPTLLLHQPLTAGLMTQHPEVPDPRPQIPPCSVGSNSPIFRGSFWYLSVGRGPRSPYRGLTVWPVKMEYRLTFSIHIILIWNFNFLNRLLILHWNPKCFGKKKNPFNEKRKN